MHLGTDVLGWANIQVNSLAGSVTTIKHFSTRLVNTTDNRTGSHCGELLWGVFVEHCPGALSWSICIGHCRGGMGYQRGVDLTH